MLGDEVIEEDRRDKAGTACDERQDKGYGEETEDDRYEYEEMGRMRREWHGRKNKRNCTMKGKI